MLKEAFPNMSWMQPRGERRGVLMTKKYLTPTFAVELGLALGCTAELGVLPPREFVQEAVRQPPIYFETAEPTAKGICCVCFKKGCLGRCPNASCGLLMHHTCVMPTVQGEALQCPICRTEVRLDKELEEAEQELPFWHEAEVGAPAGRKKKRTYPEVERAPFPSPRWPKQEEAQIHGYETIKDWYLDYRRRSSAREPSKGKQGLSMDQLVAEFVELENEQKQRTQEQEVEDEEKCEDQPPYEIVSTISTHRSSLGTVETGPALAQPNSLSDVQPLQWGRVQDHQAKKKALADALKQKWSESTTGPPEVLKDALEGGDEEFRTRLLGAQGMCPELRPLIEAARKLLGATLAESTKDAEEKAKDYRLSPLDGVLERKVTIVKAAILWVPVMPVTIVPAECFGEARDDLTWRRYAYERAHMTFLEPHRATGPTWQALKRMAFLAFHA
jgi:hypothetical protein